MHHLMEGVTCVKRRRTGPYPVHGHFLCLHEKISINEATCCLDPSYLDYGSLHYRSYLFNYFNIK